MLKDKELISTGPHSVTLKDKVGLIQYPEGHFCPHLVILKAKVVLIQYPEGHSRPYSVVLKDILNWSP